MDSKKYVVDLDNPVGEEFENLDKLQPSGTIVASVHYYVAFFHSEEGLTLQASALKSFCCSGKLSLLIIQISFITSALKKKKNERNFI